MLEPDLLLMDEPLGALDPMIRAGLQTDLKQIFSTLKKTVLMVTHDMGEAGYFGDNIVLMRAGEIVQQGSLKSLVHDPADRFVTDFITPSAVLWRISIHEEQFNKMDPLELADNDNINVIGQES